MNHWRRPTTVKTEGSVWFWARLGAQELTAAAPAKARMESPPAQSASIQGWTKYQRGAGVLTAANRRLARTPWARPRVRRTPSVATARSAHSANPVAPARRGPARDTLRAHRHAD